MKIAFGQFAEGFNQKNFRKLMYKNENASIYSIKLPFRKFLLITIKKR